MKALVVLPTYNEKENIGLLCTEILAQNLSLDLVIIDDNSPDGTGQIAEQLAQEHAQVSYIKRPGKLGLGTAHIAGIEYACQNGYDYVITMDTDFSHKPKHLRAFLEAMPQCDICLGSRYTKGGKFINWPLRRILLSMISNFCAQAWLRLGIYDCTGGYRCYKTKIFDQLHLNDVFSKGYSFLTEILFRAKICQFKLYETPIEFEDRKYGVSKINKQEFFNAIKTLLRLRLDPRVRKTYRRLKEAN